MAEALVYAPRVPDEVVYACPGERRWKKIFFSDPTFHEPDYMAIDLRSRYAFEAIGTAKSMVVSVPGQGSQYIGAYQDADGEWLTGDNTYRIHLPKDVAANMFWSLTVYDNDTRSMVRNEHGRPGTARLTSYLDRVGKPRHPEINRRENRRDPLAAPTRIPRKPYRLIPVGIPTPLIHNRLNTFANTGTSP